MLASTTTQSPCARVPAPQPELAKGHSRARFIIEGSAKEATALRNFLSASVGSSDLRRPGQLRSQRSCPAQAAQSRRVLVMAARPRGTGGGVPRRRLVAHNRSGAQLPLTPRGGGSGWREAGRPPAAAAPEQDGRHAPAAAPSYGSLRFLGGSSPSGRLGPARADD